MGDKERLEIRKEQCRKVEDQNKQLNCIGRYHHQNTVSKIINNHIILRPGRIWLACVWVFTLFTLTGCFHTSRLIRSEVVIDNMVGTTIDADVLHASSVGVDFGLVNVLGGPEAGSSRFWPSSMVEHYDKRESSQATKCLSSVSFKVINSGLYHIKARFPSPAAISDSRDHKVQANEWLNTCDCPESVGASCFEDYVIREVENKLNKDFIATFNGSSSANIPLADRRQMKRRLGTLVQTRRRILTEELGIFQRLLNDDVLPHDIERLDPGKRICFQSHSYSRAKNIGGSNAFVSALVPGASLCMKWLGLIPDPYSNGPNDILAGVDPITVLGQGWKDRVGDSYRGPINPNGFSELDYWSPIDRVVNNSTRSFPFGLLFASNYKQTVLIRDDEDLKIGAASDPDLSRSNILLLFKDSALRDFVQQNYAFEKVSRGTKFECMSDGPTHRDFHKCVSTIITEWLNLQGKLGEEAQNYFHDLVMPSNIQIFTQIPIYLEGEHRWIRTGTPLLSILDEKYRLSEEVMKARSSQTGVSNHPHDEAKLVHHALSKFSLKRRRAGRLVEIKLNEVKSLEGLAIPLVPGDELSW